MFSVTARFSFSFCFILTVLVCFCHVFIVEGGDLSFAASVIADPVREGARSSLLPRLVLG